MTRPERFIAYEAGEEAAREGDSRRMNPYPKTWLWNPSYDRRSDPYVWWNEGRNWTLAQMAKAAKNKQETP